MHPIPKNLAAKTSFFFITKIHEFQRPEDKRQLAFHSTSSGFHLISVIALLVQHN